MTGPCSCVHLLRQVHVSTSPTRHRNLHLLPIGNDLGASGDGSGLLVGTEGCAVLVAGEGTIGRVGDRVVCIPLALDGALAGGAVVRHEAMMHE